MFCTDGIGHGSNARDVDTKAVYDSSSDELVLETPSESAQKIWIGNLGQHGNTAVVFAQLYVDQVHHGVHVILVPIRNEKGDLFPGVRALDCGTKAGLNGVDNGRLWLDKVRVPRKKLLCKFGGINNQGKERL
jgi:acyl-CoA oxidase